MTVKRHFEDGLHFVWHAKANDRHPMKWRISSVKEAEVRTSRRASSLDDAIKTAKHLTKIAIGKSSHDKSLVDLYAQPLDMRRSDGPLRPDHRLSEREVIARLADLPDVVMEKFSTTHFNCIRANPVAQVWQCVSLPGDRAPVGRRRAGGKAPQQTTFRHQKGECSILFGKEPHRLANGRVAIFPTWQAAEEYANEAYMTADEEDRILWEDDGRVVGRTPNIDIIFDPDVNGARTPFSLWLPRWNKPVYAGTRKKPVGKAGKLVGGGSLQANDSDTKSAIALNQKLLDMDEDYVLTDRVAVFESIWGAEEHALQLERTLS